jgi:hypothetical protein
MEQPSHSSTQALKLAKILVIKCKEMRLLEILYDTNPS